MPVFEYKCTKCGKEFEELVVSSDVKPECPRCGSVMTEKLFSPFSSFSGGPGGGGCSHSSGGG